VTSRRKIEIGDEVRIVRAGALDDLVRLYGERAREPFIVEYVDNTRGTLAVSGAGVVAWFSHCKRVRTRRQLKSTAVLQ
jgi:hypothetical protein